MERETCMTESKTKFTIGVSLITLLLTLLIVFPAWGHLTGAGPHNENNNDVHDIWADPNGNWSGSIGLIIDDVNDTTNPGDMPLAYRRTNPDLADVHIVRNSQIENPGNFVHIGGAPDIININPNVDGGDTGERIYIHELAHSYSFQHMSELECEEVAANSTQGYSSVMCDGPTNPHHLTGHDGTDLRSLPTTSRGRAQEGA